MAATEDSVARTEEGGEDGREFATPGLVIQQLVRTDEHVLLLSGELDLVGAPGLEAVLIHVCTQTPNRVVLDLSALRFMDSTGIQAVLIAHELCRACQCEFVIVPGPTQVQQLFEITGLTRQLSFRT